MENLLVYNFRLQKKKKKKKPKKWRSTFQATIASNDSDALTSSNSDALTSSNSDDLKSSDSDDDFVELKNWEGNSVTDVLHSTLIYSGNNDVNVNIESVNNQLTVNTESVNNQLAVNTECPESVNNELTITNKSLESIDCDLTSTEESENDDSDYVPSQTESCDSISEFELNMAPKVTLQNERMLLVYESNLYELLRFCPNCGSSVDQSLIQEVKNTGSQLHLKIACFNNCDIDWKSQPTVGGLKGVGNLFLATSIAFSGLTFAKIQRFAWLINLKFISDSVYYQLRRDFILPVIRQKWNVERKKMINILRSRNLIVLIGDGRCDSPGHNAKYCTYTFMESETGKVVDTIIIPVTEVANSNAMEKAGFVKIIKRLKDAGVKIDIVSTDRHIQIRKLMKVDPEFNDIKHQFDPWHIAKGICKKLHKASKKKARESLLEWLPSIINHFWWSVTSSNEDPQLLYEMFSSVIYHTVNKHEWPGCKLFKKCAHSPLTNEEQKQKKWLVEG